MSQCENRAAFRFTWPGRDESFICLADAVKLQAVADGISLPLQLIPVTDGAKICRQQVSGKKCGACAGCGLVADDEDHTPWLYWAELEPPANIAVVMGLVKPMLCDGCKGAGNIVGDSLSDGRNMIEL